MQHAASPQCAGVGGRGRTCFLPYFTYPVAFQLTTYVAGPPENDSYEFVWSTWGFKQALLDLRQNPARI